MADEIGLKTQTPHTHIYVILKSPARFSRIKITEHFAADGKPVGELVEKLIHHKIKEKMSKIA